MQTNLSSLIANNTSEDGVAKKVACCVRELLTLSYCLEQEAFQEGAEFRFCYFSENNSKDRPLISPLEHRESDRKIKPFHLFDFSEHKNIVREIILGPKCQLDIDQLENFLKENSYSSVACCSSLVPDVYFFQKGHEIVTYQAFR